MLGLSRRPKARLNNLLKSFAAVTMNCHGHSCGILNSEVHNNSEIVVDAVFDLYIMRNS